MTQTTTTTAPRRALIVVDVQNIYADGPLLIEHPPVQDSLVRIGQAMDAARAAGIPTVVVQEDSFGIDTQGWKIHNVVASRPHDLLVHKTLPSAFTHTGLAAWLADVDARLGERQKRGGRRRIALGQDCRLSSPRLPTCRSSS